MTLYLKYRPKDFDSLVGQDFVKETLKQAILKDKLVGAYLFCGPRGTGKTSSARIFAKAMNCKHLRDGNPCNECDICTSCNNESLVDIIEIDAASYTGVDNIRDIIERAQFSPTKATYKVYIIDEVHMLSKGAFNALLKILEEPPTHLKFILATTEIHKVPETILSRCQRYDFRSITSHDLQHRLRYIAKTEGITIDDESLLFITKQSNGGLRNAISLFEQLIVNNEINFENVINNFGIPKTQVLEDFYMSIFHGNDEIIPHFETTIASYNINLFLKELLFFIKDKMIASLHNENELKRNIFLLEILEEVYGKLKTSFDAKTTFLVGILKCVKNIQPLKLQEPQEGKIPSIPTSKSMNAISIEEKAQISFQKNKQEEISHEDLFDVFGNDDFGFQEDISIIDPPDSKPKLTENEVGAIKDMAISVSSGNFDLEKFIAGLKNLGAKGALTMSLRASSISFDGKNLTIYTKTKISLKQISTADNISLMMQSLENIGLQNINIEVK